MYHMEVYNVTYKSLYHTHFIISTELDMGWYNPPKKVKELEIDSLLTLSIINRKIWLGTHKIFHPKQIIEKPEHSHMR